MTYPFLRRAAYFFRTPASVLPRFCVAAFAAGVSTALPCETGAVPAAPVCGTPMLLPVVPRFSASDVFGPGDPPVPLMVVPFERVEPAAAPPPVPVEPAALPAELCAKAIAQVPR